jgi:hypothetical protein
MKFPSIPILVLVVALVGATRSRLRATDEVRPPEILAQQLIDVTPDSARVEVTVARNGAPTSVGVEYGTDTNYGTINGTIDDPGATDGTLTVRVPMIGLTAGTIYHYRVLASNNAGNVVGADQSFTAGNQPPVARLDQFTRRTGPGPFELLVLGNDTDAESDPLLIITVTQGSHGSVTIAQGGASVFYEGTDPSFAGDDLFTYTIADGSGATSTATVFMHVGRLPVLTEILFSTGDSVPNISGHNVPLNAKFIRFGYPSINDLGQLAFSAAIFAPGTGFQQVIIGPDNYSAPTILVISGDPVPDELGTPTLATFTTLGHPLLNNAGDVLFSATVRGPGVTTANDQGLWSYVNGQLRRVAREGDAAPGAPGATFRTFTSVALGEHLAAPDGGPVAPSPVIAFVARLASPSGSISRINNRGLWRFRTNVDGAPANELLLRAGVDFDPNLLDASPGKRLVSFTALEPQTGAAGHGFAIVSDTHNGQSQDLLARVLFADGEQAITEFRTENNGLFPPVSGTASQAGFTSFGIPTQSTDGQNGFVARRVVASSDKGTSDGALFVANDLDTSGVFEVAHEGAPLLDLENVTFAKFQTVVNNGLGSIAFVARFAGDGVDQTNDSGVFMDHFNGIHLLAREGSSAPGADDATFLEFTSLAMPSFGQPIFTAKILDPQTQSRHTGLWFADDDGALRLAIQEGDPIAGEKGGRVRKLDILNYVLGSPAQTRSFNRRGVLIYRVSFSKSRQAIIRSTIPGVPND